MIAILWRRGCVYILPRPPPEFNRSRLYLSPGREEAGTSSPQPTAVSKTPGRCWNTGQANRSPPYEHPG